jgi:hypothetical protein
MTISAAGNTEASAFHVLIAKGYAVTYDRVTETWTATKDKLDASPDGALSLLGLVAMIEARGENWMATENETDAYFALLEST